MSRSRQLAYVRHALLSSMRIQPRLGFGVWTYFLSWFVAGTRRIRVKGLPTAVFVRGRSTDAECLLQVVHRRDLDRVMARQVRTILDLGANVGYASLWMAARYPDARILAVEPDSENFDLLRRNLQDISSVSCLRAAVGAEDGQAKCEDRNRSAWARKYEPADPMATDTVPMFSVSSLMRLMGGEVVDVLKMDIEGAERILFEGDVRWLDRVRWLAIEIHCGCWLPVVRALAVRSFDACVSGEYLIICLDGGRLDR